MEQMRDFDFVMFEHDVLTALSGLISDITSTLAVTVLGGFAATQASPISLSINLAAGRIYQFAPADLVGDGSIPQDLNTIVQQGYNPAQVITLIAPSSGQSQWNLIQAQFSQVDAVRAGDPNGGIVPFYNAANPSQPTLNSVNTVRQAKCVLQVISGAAATTGSETPPTPTSGWVPLYLIDLAGGQTQITTSQIITAGPNVGTGVSGTYPYAPFLAGFLASHHSGTPGQAPKIKLGSEVQGVLPYVNMSSVRTLLNGNLTLYVNPSTGSDSNSGLTSSVPFRTAQGAFNSMYHAYDWNGFAGTISAANGTYTTGVTISGLPPGMFQPISLVGNLAAPGSVAFSLTNGTGFFVSQGAQLNLSGCQIGATGLASALQGYALYAWMGGIINFGTMTFAACTNGHLVGQNGGSIFSNQTLGFSYSIIGGAASGSHMTADAGGVVSTSNAVVTLTGTPAFVAFAAASRAGVIQVNYLTNTYTGSATGAKFILSTGATIGQTGVLGTPNISFLPGSTAGANSAFTPGYYQ